MADEDEKRHRGTPAFEVRGPDKRSPPPGQPCGIGFWPANHYMRAMQIPGHIDPVAVPRGEIAPADGRVHVVRLTRAGLRAELIATCITDKQAERPTHTN